MPRATEGRWPTLVDGKVSQYQRDKNSTYSIRLNVHSHFEELLSGTAVRHSHLMRKADQYSCPASQMEQRRQRLHNLTKALGAVLLEWLNVELLASDLCKTVKSEFKGLWESAFCLLVLR